MMRVKVRDVQPNAHRDFVLNPIDNERVEKFKDSIQENTFWENLVGRLKPFTLLETSSDQDEYRSGGWIYNEKGDMLEVANDGGYPIEEFGDSLLDLSDDDFYRRREWWDDRYKKGGVELAMGHHRLEALRQLYGEDYEFDIRLRDFDDAQMLRAMVAENDEYGGNQSDVIDEAVRQAKKYLEANIDEASEYGDLEKQHDDFQKSSYVGNIIITHFLQNVPKGQPLKSRSSWNRSKVQRSLSRMDLIDDGKVSRKIIRELPSETHASEFTRSLKKADVEFTPKEQENIVSKITRNEMGTRDVGKVVAEAAWDKKFGKPKKKDKDREKLKHFDQHLSEVSNRCMHLSDDFVKLQVMRDEIVNYTEDSITNREIFFASIGKLQRKINKLLDIIATKAEKEEIINTLKLN